MSAEPLVQIQASEPLLKIIETASPIAEKVSTSQADFWLIGGLSFVGCAFSYMAQSFYGLNQGFDRYIMTWPALFSAMSLICNHPHFMSSYRLAYGGGTRALKTHWFALLIVPFCLLSLFVFAYLLYSDSLYSLSAFKYLDSTFPDSPILKFALYDNSAGEIVMRVGIWTMWITVGWHYAKQVFGIMLSYAKDHQYSITKIEKWILKFCLLAVVPTSFIALAMQTMSLGNNYYELSMGSFDFSKNMFNAWQGLSIALAAIFIALIARKAVLTKRLPPVNFVVPFVAFYLWWYPGLWPQPYAALMVPFFHSMQYLPFAYRRMNAKAKTKTHFVSRFRFEIALILIAGFLFFDFLPTLLDDQSGVRNKFGVSFFVIASAVFLNVHHFFIDSAIWRSKSSSSWK